jgi:hypothetical protein
MANVLFGSPVYSDVGVLVTPTLAGGSWEATLPLTNLQDRRLHRVARSSSAAEADTRLQLDLGAERPVRVVCVPKHNLSVGAKWRAVGRASDAIFAYAAGEDLAARGGVFARTGTATFVDRGGVVRTAATGVIRDGHWIGGERTLLLEPASTNLCVRSEEFDTWTDINTCNVTANAIAAPDGTMTADLLTATVVGSERRRTVTFTADGEKCIAVYVKAGTSPRSVVTLRDTTASANRHQVRVTWTAGVPSLTTESGAGTMYPVEALANGWYRILFSATGVVAANTNVVNVGPDILNGTGSVYAWGAQAENAVVPSSYIKTEGSTVTRNADSLYFDVPALNPPRAMTVYVRGVEGDRLASGVNTRIFTLSNASDAAPRLLCYRPSASAGYRVLHNPSGNSETTSQGTTAVRGDVLELRSTVSEAGAAGIGVSVNGGSESTNAAAPQALAGSWSGTRLTLNATGTGTNVGQFAYTHVLIAEGVRTMDEMRAGQPDTGWRDAYPAGWTAEDIAGLNVPLLHAFPETVTARYWSVQVSDPTNPAGYVDLGRLIVAGGFQPSINMAYGAGLGFDNETVRETTDGGAALYDAKPTRRSLTGVLDLMPETDAYDEWFRLVMRHGKSGQLVVVYDPDDTGARARQRAFLAVLKELSPIEHPYHVRFRTAFSALEEL